MDVRVSRFGVLLFVAASCSSGGTTGAQGPAPSTTTIAAVTTAPVTKHVDSLTPSEVAIAQEWVERLGAGTASYSADFGCGICAIGGLFSITEQHGAMTRSVYTGNDPKPDGEPWTLTKALTDVLASGGNSSVTEVGDSALVVHVDMDPFPGDDAEYTYRADQIEVVPDESVSPVATEADPAPDGTLFIFPLVTRTLQGPNDDVVAWAAAVRDEVLEASTVPLIVPATLAAGESVNLDISRITDNPLGSTIEILQSAGTTIITSYGNEAACEISGGFPWLPAPVRGDQTGCVADLSTEPGLNRVANWTEADRSWNAQSELATTDTLATLLNSLLLAPAT